MLKAHFAAIENMILSASTIASNAGHNLHRGTPREVLIKEFLEEHLSEKLGIGTGEIIDSKSLPRSPRNQIDIVIYRKEYPKLSIGGGITAFLAESVIATIEVKSILSQTAIKQAVGTANSIKQLERSFVTGFETGHEKPGILSYIVAYDGSWSRDTIKSWLDDAHKSHQICLPKLSDNHNDCQRIKWPSIDGVFMLGKGFLLSDTSAITYLPNKIRQEKPDRQWVWSDSENGNLLLLFMLLTQASCAIEGRWINGRPYLEGFSPQTVYYI